MIGALARAPLPHIGGLEVAGEIASGRGGVNE